MRLKTEWWGIILEPDDEKDEEILRYLALNIRSEGRRNFEIYEEGTVELKSLEEGGIQNLEIHR